MSKNMRFIAIMAMVGLCLVLAAVIGMGGNAGDGHGSTVSGTPAATGEPANDTATVQASPGGDDPMSAINATLVGTNLTYTNIAGKPMNYTITAQDIVSVDPIEYNGSPAWKVRVGRGLAWDLTLDADGKRVLETKQLFNT